jgi:hypothetical protein
VAFKVCYAYGLRRREMTMLDLEDFGPNPHVSEYAPTCRNADVVMEREFSRLLLLPCLNVDN